MCNVQAVVSFKAISPRAKCRKQIGIERFIQLKRLRPDADPATRHVFARNLEFNFAFGGGQFVAVHVNIRSKMHSPTVVQILRHMISLVTSTERC